jgi:hypothetical protein
VSSTKANVAAGAPSVSTGPTRRAGSVAVPTEIVVPGGNAEVMSIATRVTTWPAGTFTRDIVVAENGKRTKDDDSPSASIS